MHACCALQENSASLAKLQTRHGIDRTLEGLGKSADQSIYATDITLPAATLWLTTLDMMFQSNGSMTEHFRDALHACLLRPSENLGILLLRVCWPTKQQLTGQDRPRVWFILLTII
jgi:hypothetical protein